MYETRDLHFTVNEDTTFKVPYVSEASELFSVVDANRYYLRQWLPFLDDTQSEKDTLNFILQIHKQLNNNNGIQAAVYHKQQLCGMIGHHFLDSANARTSIGYWLAEGYQGRGIMTECCRRFINYTFNELKMNRIEIKCATGNVRSQAIPQRLGCIREGILREAEWLYDHYVDLELFSVLRKEWV